MECALYCMYVCVVWHGMAWHGETQLKYAIAYFAIHFLFIFHNLFSVHIPVVSSFSVYSPLFFFQCPLLLFFVLCALFVLFVVHFWHVYFLCSPMPENCISGLSVEYTIVCMCLSVCVPVAICEREREREGLPQCRLTWPWWWWLVFDTDHIISSNMYFVYFVYSVCLKYHKSKGMTQSFFVPRKRVANGDTKHERERKK